MLFFEADTGGGQIRGVNQAHRPGLPKIAGEQRRQHLLVDASQARHAHTSTERVHHPHVGHATLTAQTSKLSPRALLRQHFDQQVNGVNRREQGQQVNAIQLGGGVFAMPSAGGVVGPAVIDEIVGDERGEEFKQCRRARGREIGIHGHQATLGNLTRQRECPTPEF